MNFKKPYGIENLSLDFKVNKKIDIYAIFSNIKKKFVIGEQTLFLALGYYKFKSNIVLICLTNEKIFIDSTDQNKLSFLNVYSYKEITGIIYNKSESFLKKSYVEFKTQRQKFFKLYGISQENFFYLQSVFNEQKDKYLKKLDSSYSLVSALDIQDSQPSLVNTYSQTFSKDNTKQDDINVEEKPKDEELEDDLDDSSSNPDDKPKELGVKYNTKSKVINDLTLSNRNTLSSNYLFLLLTSTKTLLPNNKKTILSEFEDRIKLLEQKSKKEKNFDEKEIHLNKKESKVNTVPVLVEEYDLNNNEIDESLHTRLLFTKNWFEYTKHNVANKILGIDKDGKGVYLDKESALSNKSSVIHVYKAKSYKLNEVIRSGLRPGQSLTYYGNNNIVGLNMHYYEVESKKNLDINEYDGIIFKGQKYYFNTYDEFSRLQKKYLRIFYEDKKPEYQSYYIYELIFEDEMVTYYVYTNKMVSISETKADASKFDLKWLNFFKD